MLQKEKIEFNLPATEETLAGSAVSEPQTSLIEPLLILADRKFFIFKFVVAAVILTVVTVLLWPSKYTAKAKLMPPQQSQSMASAMMGQLGFLASAAGKDFGLRNPSELYVVILRSDTIANDLVDRFGFMKDFKKRDQAIKKLQDMSEITTEREGVIYISVTDREPQRAADIANAYIDELRKITQTLGVTEAGRRRIFFEQEVQKAADELAKAEVALKQTQEKTGIIELGSQAKAMIESLTYLQAQLAAKEAEVEAMRSFATSENPDFVRAHQQVESLRAELAKVQSGQGGTSLADISTRGMPAAGLEYFRKYRDLRYQESLWETLTKQYEIARIDEAKDASLIQPLDKARPPEFRSSPKRAIIVIVMTILAFIVAIVWVLFVEALARAKEDPQLAGRLQLLKSRLLQGPWAGKI